MRASGVLYPLVPRPSSAGGGFRTGVGEVRGSRGRRRGGANWRENSLGELEVGESIDVSIFEVGEKVDAIASSKGRGFAGGVKRWGFHGGPKTHGQSDRHRAPGSIGAGTSPGRVLKGLKMAGHFGNARITSRNLVVMSVDKERNILLLRGSVPGARNSLVMVRKAGRRRK